MSYLHEFLKYAAKLIAHALLKYWSNSPQCCIRHQWHVLISSYRIGIAKNITNHIFGIQDMFSTISGSIAFITGWIKTSYSQQFTSVVSIQVILKKQVSKRLKIATKSFKLFCVTNDNSARSVILLYESSHISFCLREVYSTFAKDGMNIRSSRLQFFSWFYLKFFYRGISFDSQPLPWEDQYKLILYCFSYESLWQNKTKNHLAWRSVFTKAKICFESRSLLSVYAASRRKRAFVHLWLFILLEWQSTHAENCNTVAFGLP